MKKIAILTTAASISLLFTSPSMAADTTATAEATAYATIVAPLTITETTHLNFGKIVSPTSAITVTLTPAGVISSSAGSKYLLGGHQAAQFTVTGAANQNVTITLPDDFTIENGGNSMTVSSPTSSASNPSAFPLGETGTATFNMGATLAVGASQAQGEYSGTYDVTVSY